MKIVNDPENLPKNILITKLGLRNSLVIKFLDELTSKGLGNGVKRTDCYVVNTDGILRIPGNSDPKLYTIFIKFIQICSDKGFNLVMIKI